MLIGKMRERVAIKSMARTADGKGGFTEGFGSTLATVWAKVEALSASEREAGSQVEHARRYEVTIRYLSTVTPAMRLTWGSRTLKIEGLQDLTEERKRFLLLTCEECPA